MDFSLVFVLSLYMINLIAVVLLLFVEKKTPTVTLSWLLVLTFMPVIGMILYFMLGSTYKLKIMTRKYSLEKVEEEYNQAVSEELTIVGEKNSQELANIMYYQDAVMRELNSLEEIPEQPGYYSLVIVP